MLDDIMTHLNLRLDELVPAMIQNHCVYFEGLCLFPSWQRTEGGADVFLEAVESDV